MRRTIGRMRQQHGRDLNTMMVTHAKGFDHQQFVQKRHLRRERGSQQEAGDQAEREHRAAQRDVGQQRHCPDQNSLCGLPPAVPRRPSTASAGSTQAGASPVFGFPRRRSIPDDRHVAHR